VRSASASASASLADDDSITHNTPTLAWFCLDSLLDSIRALRRKGRAEDHLHRLHLTLISTIPSLPLSLLPRILDEARAIIVERPSAGADEEAAARKKELVQALFDEILENVGDREKEFALRWWYDHREELETMARSTVATAKAVTTPAEPVAIPRL